MNEAFKVEKYSFFGSQQHFIKNHENGYFGKGSV